MEEMAHFAFLIKTIQPWPSHLMYIIIIIVLPTVELALILLYRVAALPVRLSIQPIMITEKIFYTLLTVPVLFKKLQNRL